MCVEVCSLGLVAVVVLLQGGGPDGLGFANSFAPSNIFAGGFGGSAGTVSSADETMKAFALSPTGWTLVLAPFAVFAVFVIGAVVGQLRRSSEDAEEAMADLVG